MKKVKLIGAVAAVAGVLSAGGTAWGGLSSIIVNNNNLDSPGPFQTEGVKNGADENTGGATTFGTADPGAEGYWQGFQTGPSGNINQLTVDLSVLATSLGHNTAVSGADTATFYLYSFPGAEITSGSQIGLAIATLTASQIEGGTLVGFTGGNDIYQYSLISSLSSYQLAAGTAYAIVLETSDGSQDVGWAESNTEANGDMGEFDHVNTGGNNGGAYGQLSLSVVPEPTTLISGGLLMLPFGASTLRFFRKKSKV